MGRKAFRDGRPVPSGQIVDRLRVALDRSMDELERRGKPLHIQLADGFEKDPARMISAIRSILPADVQHTILDVTQLHLQAVRDLSKAHALAASSEQPLPITIDAEKVVVNVDQGTSDK